MSAEIQPWSEGTDGEIVRLLDAAAAGVIDLQRDCGWAVGDTRRITLKRYNAVGPIFAEEEEVDIVITSFSEYNNCGNLLQFDFKTCPSSKFRMNDVTATGNDYRFTVMHTDILNVDLYEALPAQFRARLKPFFVYAKGGGANNKEIDIITENKLAMRSSYEVFGTSPDGVPDGTQLPYYETPANRIKTLGVNGAAVDWWLRSPSGDYDFNNVSSEGTASHADGRVIKGIAPFGCLGGIASQPEDGIPIDAEHFPDTEFRNYVYLNYDRNRDGVLNADEIARVKSFNLNQIYGSKISSLAGLEYFSNITHIELNNLGKLTYIDVSGFKDLEYLNIQICENLTGTIDLSNNPKLKTLFLRVVCIEELDLTNNTELEVLSLGWHTSPVNRSYNVKMIKNLDVSMCPKLRRLDFHMPSTHELWPNEQLETLILGEKLYLEKINGNYSHLSSLDVSGCPHMKYIEMISCPNLTSLNAAGCSELTEVTVGPGPLETLNLEGCASMYFLDCSDNNLSTLNFKGGPALEALYCENNHIDYLDLTDCTNLKWLKCSNNELEELDLSNCSELIECRCDDNQIGSIDVSACRKLWTISCARNRLTELLFSGSYTHLLSIFCQENLLQKLNVSSCTHCQDLYCHFNQLTSLNVKNVTNLQWVITNAEPVSISIYEEEVRTYLQYKASQGSDPDDGLPQRDGDLCIDPNVVLTDGLIKILSQPADVVAEVNGSITLSVVASGDDLTYRWDKKIGTNGTWSRLPGDGTESSITMTATTDLNDTYYRCYISDGNSYVYTRSAHVTVKTAPIIIQHPVNVTVKEGRTATFNINVLGIGLTYQWQMRDGSDEWTAIPNSNASSYQILAETSINGRQFRCFVLNDIGEVYSNSATLTVTADSRAITPSTLNLVEGHSGSFSVETSSVDVGYAWEYSKDDGSTWDEIRSSNEANLSVIATLALNGYKYRCTVTIPGSRYIVTDPVTLAVTQDTSVARPTITSQPSSATVATGSSVIFAVQANGNDLHYQWQVFMNNQWQSITDATNSYYEITATRSLDGSSYRCVVSNAAGTAYSSEAILNVSVDTYVSTPRVLTQPKSVNVDLGELVTFWVRADGGGLSYQWQKLNGSTWYDITGAVSASYSLMARTEVHNTQYRCVVTNTAGSAYSNSATLSIRVGQDLSFYGYHSIIISGKNTYGEWEMYPTSRPHVAPPEVKTNYVDLPGADGGLDYTDLLTGEPRFGYRKGSWEFLLIPQDRWAAVYRSLVSFLHGRRHTVILEDDPNFVYSGRLTVNDWKSEPHHSLIVIDYVLEPFARDISGEEEDARTNEILDAANELLSRQENAGLVIAKVTGGTALVDPEMLFENGDIIAY